MPTELCPNACNQQVDSVQWNVWKMEIWLWKSADRLLKREEIRKKLKLLFWFYLIFYFKTSFSSLDKNEKPELNSFEMMKIQPCTIIKPNKRSLHNQVQLIILKQYSHVYDFGWSLEENTITLSKDSTLNVWIQ